MHLSVDILLVGCGSGWCNKAWRGITGGYRKIVYTEKIRKYCQSPRHMVKIFLFIVLVAHVDLFEQSSSPPESNIKWPKTGGS